MPNQPQRGPTDVHRVSRLLMRYLVGAGSLAMVILLILQVGGRYAFGYSFSWTEEAARYAMIWTAMLGAGLAASSGAGLSAFTLLRDRHGKVGRVFSLISAGATGLFLLVLIYAGFLYAFGSTGHASPGLGISKAWVYAALPVGALLLVPGMVAIARPNPAAGEFGETGSLPAGSAVPNHEMGSEPR